MRCSSCETRLDRYVEGTLAPREMAELNAHLRSCSDCTGLVTELRVIDALLATTKPVELPPNFTFAVMAEARNLAVPIRRTLSVWALLAFYLIGAWIALSGAFITVGTRIPPLASEAHAMQSALTQSFAAISGAADGFGASTPFVFGIVSAALVLDVMLVFAIVLFHRTLHPQLAARLARSEAS